MKETRFRFVDGNVEHVIAESVQSKCGAHHVEIITDGMRKLVFIDGKRLHKVLAVDVPLTQGEISPQITIKLHPDKITVRHVDGAQFKGIMDATHPGERIIPAADNAASTGWSHEELLRAGETLSQSAAFVRAPGWSDEVPKPSKRELLEQILAEQRKTNELLADAFGDQVMRTESTGLVNRLLDESVEHAVKVVARANSQFQPQHERTQQASPRAPNH